MKQYLDFFVKSTSTLIFILAYGSYFNKIDTKLIPNYQLGFVCFLRLKQKDAENQNAEL